MTTSVTDRVRAFRQLHHSGCFVIPNPWDLGSARLLEQLGFRALATTSAGFAWSLGKRDGRVTLEEALDHVRAIAHGVDVPVNADFEGGFAIEPAAVGALEVWPFDFPGFKGLHLEPGPAPHMGYIAAGYATGGSETFHFTDGNASITRLLVRL